jgi:putative endonuclease
MSTDTRRALGAHGEAAAVRHLEAAGYAIVARNYRTRHGELDIVAADDRHLVFCEVKTRVAGSGGPPLPLDAVGPAKRRRLRRMASEWLVAHAADPARPRRDAIRFDAIGVTVTPTGELLSLEHVEGAF